MQSLTCNSNECPVGIATQNPALTVGVVVKDKAVRVARFHAETVTAAMEIVASAGLDHPEQLNRSHIFRRISQSEIKRYDEIYPYPIEASLLGSTFPGRYKQEMTESNAESFKPSLCFAEHTTGLAPLS